MHLKHANLAARPQRFLLMAFRDGLTDALTEFCVVFSASSQCPQRLGVCSWPGAWGVRPPQWLPGRHSEALERRDVCAPQRNERARQSHQCHLYQLQPDFYCVRVSYFRLLSRDSMDGMNVEESSTVQAVFSLHKGQRLLFPLCGHQPCSLTCRHVWDHNECEMRYTKGILQSFPLGFV